MLYSEDYDKSIDTEDAEDLAILQEIENGEEGIEA